MLGTYKEITSESEFKSLIEEYNNGTATYIALDTETTGIDRFNDKLLSISITAHKSGKAFFVDRAYIKPLELLNKPLTLHNFKFDFHMLISAGINGDSLRLYRDTLFLDHLLEENNSHALDDIIQRRYQDNYKQIFWEKYKDYGNAPRYEQVEYACKDVLYTDRVCSDTLSDLAYVHVPDSLINHVHKLALTLFNTELEGIRVDLPYVSKMADVLGTSILNLTKEIHSKAYLDIEILENNLYEKELDKRKTPKGKLSVKRPSFSLDSPIQLCELLYDHIGLPAQFSKKRSRTVDDEALNNLEATKHPIIPLLREYRANKKVFGSFIEGTLERVKDGVIYPSFNACGTVTGRISSSNPNLQQLPSKGGVRGIYVPKEGYRFISADYKQLEVTLAAHFSRDPALLSIVYEGASQHDITAAGLGIPRSLAKTINFGMLYGAGPSKIASVLGCSLEEAERAYNKYWDTYPGVRDFNRRCHAAIDRGEPIINPWGRRRHFPKTYENKWDKERAKRQAPNALIQSTGADSTNYSFYTVDAKLRELGYGKALISIHDEIIIEVLENKVDESKNILQTVMESAAKVISLSVPLTVDVSDGMERWND